MTAVTFDGIRKLGRAVAYYPNLAKPLGGATSAILFSQLLYWHERAETQLGTYKTIEEIEAETGLTRREQETACKNLEKLGILTKTHKRLQHRMYYKLNPEAFDKAMADFETVYAGIGETTEATFPNVQNRHSGERETAIRETAKPPLDECTKPPSVIGTLDYHKITNTRLLTEINSGLAAAPAVEILDAAKTEPTEPKAPPKTADEKIRANPDNVKTWNAYAAAYRRRYGILPESNRKTRGQVAQFVKLVGAEKAVLLAAYFPTHNGRWFVQCRHEFGQLLKSYQQVATDQALGQQMTETRARQAESTQANLESHNGALEILKKHYGLE